MSRFSHATPDWIMLPLMSKEQNRISVDLVNNNSDVISDVAKVITSHLQFQYFIFRIFFLKDISSVDELKKRDSELFDPANVVKLGNTFTGEGRSLEELYNFVMEAYENQ